MIGYISCLISQNYFNYLTCLKICFFLLSYDKLSKKPLMLFKSFTGLSAQQFDDIYKGIESKNPKYKMKLLSYSKKRRQRPIDAGRHFKDFIGF